MPPQIRIDSGTTERFCVRWRIEELSLFGSVLRADFGPSSDIDVLVRFAADAPWSLWDLVTIRDELAQLFECDVHLLEIDGLRNPFRRRSILNSRQVIYAA